MIEFRRVIVIDKATEDLRRGNPTGAASDVNLKSLADNLTEQSGECEERFTFHRSYSYREVMNNLLQSPYVPALVVDRFCLTEKDPGVELTLRAACKSIASVTSLPWITAERWDTSGQKWHFIQETGELLNTPKLVARMEEAMGRRERFLTSNDILGGNISGLELLALLQSLATSFPYNFCYIHNMKGDERACLYFSNNRLIHCLFYNQRKWMLAQGQEALELFITMILQAARANPGGIAKRTENNFVFRFMAQPDRPDWLNPTLQLSTDEAFIQAIADIETRENRTR